MNTWFMSAWPEVNAVEHLPHPFVKDIHPPQDLRSSPDRPYIPQGKQRKHKQEKKRSIKKKARNYNLHATQHNAMQLTLQTFEEKLQ